MFYRFIRQVARFVVWLLHGSYTIKGYDELPSGTYILAAPHRTWWEPIMFALAASPREFTFMAKKELFKNPILAFILRHAHAFSVDREHPGPSAIKTPVRYLKKEGLSLIIFPSGTRYARDLKGGTALIAKLAKVPIVPAVYQGPLTFKGFLKHQPVTIGFGQPITVDSRQKLDDAFTKTINDKLQESWNNLDRSLDPTFSYTPLEKSHH